MSAAGSIFSKVAGMASTLGVGSRAALLPRAPRIAPNTSRSIKTSAARAQEGNMQNVGRTGARRDPAAGSASTAPARTSNQAGSGALQRSAPGWGGALSPFTDFGAVAPTFGRVGGFLRSIEQEMDQMLQALATGNLDQAPPEFRDVLVPLHVDIQDKDSEIVIKADTPGLTGADLTVVLDPDTKVLTIEGDRVVDDVAPDDDDDVLGADVDLGTTSAAGTAAGAGAGDATAGDVTASGGAAAGDATRPRADARTRDRGYTRVERKIGRFIRRFKLPDNIDADNVTAKVTNGVLEVHMPKTGQPDRNQRTIDVQ